MRLCAVFLLLLFLPFSAKAETSLAVIDVQALFVQSSAAKSIEKQMSSRREQFLAEVSVKEQALREAEKNLAAQRETLEKDKFTAEAKAFEEKLHETRHFTQVRKRMLDEASAKGISVMRQKIDEIVREIATARGYTLVISKQNVVVGDPSLDITEEAMKKLNEALPTVQLEFKDE